MTYLWKCKITKMNKYISAITLLMAISFSAYAQKTSNVKSISYLSMQRTACFGRCPTYMVEIYKNGLVRYTGRQFTEYTGVYERNLGSKKVAPLLKEFASYRVDTCKELYENNIPDLPGLIYNFKIDGKETKIYNAGFGPKYLDYLGMQVDKLVKPTKSWKKVRDLKPEE